jgi:hypothetical protein
VALTSTSISTQSDVGKAAAAAAAALSGAAAQGWQRAIMQYSWHGNGPHRSKTSFLSLLMLGLLSANTIVLLSDHRWLAEFKKGMEGLAHGSSSSSLATIPTAGSSSSKSAVGSSSSSRSQQQLSMWDVFPQSGKCNLSPQLREYTQMHAAIVNGLAKPHYLVSVAPQTGAADRLTGTVTQLYFALLSKRAFTAYNPDPGTIPKFAAACDYPLFNWTHPEPLPDAVVDAFHTWNHVANDSAMHQTLPPPYDEVGASWLLQLGLVSVSMQ